MSRSADVRYTFTSSSTANFEVVSFELDEALSADWPVSDGDVPLPFRLAVELSSFDDCVDFSELIDAPAHLAIWRDGEVVRHVHGVVTSWLQGDSGFHRTRYSAVVEPALVRLTLRSGCRIFQQQSVPEIIGVLLKEHGLQEVQWNLGGTHLPREFCCQWNESDWAYIQRIAAEEGIVLAIEHDAQAHRLIFTDSTQSLPDGGDLLYQPMAGGVADQPSLRRFQYAERMASASYRQRDYTFWNARYGLEHQATPYASLPHLGQAAAEDEYAGTSYSSSPHAPNTAPDRYERYAYPGGYKRDEAGRPFTRTRLDAERRDAAQAVGSGDDARVIPGTTYTLQGHSRSAWNRRWRVVRVHHEGRRAWLAWRSAAWRIPAGTASPGPTPPGTTVEEERSWARPRGQGWPARLAIDRLRDTAPPGNTARVPGRRGWKGAASGLTGGTPAEGRQVGRGARFARKVRGVRVPYDRV